jgi:hypothetical protein
MAPASIPTMPDTIFIQLTVKLGPALRQTRKKLSAQDHEILWRHMEGGLSVLKARCQNAFVLMKNTNLQTIEGYKDWTVNDQLFCQTAKSLPQTNFTLLNDDNLEEIVAKSWKNYFSYTGTNEENQLKFKLFLYCEKKSQSRGYS